MATTTSRARTRRPPQPFSLDHWRAYSERIILDTDDYWDLEDFHLEVVKPILAGVREVWAVLPEGNTKAQWVHTPLPTPDGWTTMLDVQIGDELLGSDGMPTTVKAVSEVKLGEDCYRVTFSDGSFSTVGGDHLWAVQDASDHYRDHVYSTRYLHNRPLSLSKKGKSGTSSVARWRVATAGRNASPEVDLPIDPYVLGVWLGDGSSAAGSVTSMDQDVWDVLEERMGLWDLSLSNIGKVAPCRYVRGLAKLLRENGLLGNKHIPDQYLIAGEDDRWALLQGLMDTDGCVSKAGQATYCGTSERLINDVRRLVWSLGLPCSLSETRAVLNGVDYGPSYRLTLSCDQRHPVARLARKVGRLKRYGMTCDHRRIVSIDRVTSVPVKCLQVDAEDGIYLTDDAYVPTHNTTLMAGFALYHCDYTSSPWVPIAASSRDQAEILATQAYDMIRRTPGLPARFKIQEGYRRILSLRNGGRGIKVYAADAGTGDGVIPTLCLCDEGHRWPDLSLYRLWKGKLRKRHGQIVMISTAGEPGGEFEETRDAIRNKATRRRRKGAHLYSEGANIVMNEWAIEKPEWISNMKKVKAANPFSGITEESLEDEFNSPTTDLGDWKRLKCNLPSRSANAAITEMEWDKAKHKKLAAIPTGEHTDLGVDVAWKHDTFAMVPMWRDLTGSKEMRLIGKPRILKPPRDGSMLSVDAVKIAFEELNELNPIEAAVMDIERAEDVAQWMEDEYDVTVIDRPQGNANAVEDYDAFMRALRGGILKHVGDPEMRQHVMNAIARMMPSDKKRFDRPSQSRAKRKQVVRVIDGLTAAGMVNHYLSQFSGDDEPLVAWR